MEQYHLPTNPLEEDPCGQAVASLPVPEPAECEKLQEKAGKSHDSHTPELMVRQRHGKLFDELDLSGLDLWTPELVDAAHQLLAEYHDVFSLDPAELGCTHSTEHIIKVTDNTPFKKFHCQWLRRLGITYRKCWNLVQLDLARVPGVTPWY